MITCRPRILPVSMHAAAAARAVAINPANAVAHRTALRTPTGRRGGPRRLAVLVGRRWPTTGVRLSVSFMDTPPKDLRSRILLHMNAWGKTANVVFKETRGVGQVRIARLDRPDDMAGYWSWIGTEILEIPDHEPTLNLESFTMNVSEREFHRVVRHEAGHTLGFEHEHMRSDLVKRIDVKKAIAFYDQDQGWTAEEVKAQVLTPLKNKSIMGTKESDPLSIMCYQIPGDITRDGKPIPGGIDINARDYAFAASIYPKSVNAPKRRR
ncbi:MAG TPA: M12 family metallopeptidase [Vicinamibacterales bacterium]|nr:M12 family metallopeptidase [Vicinamibacterales bacterium]